MGSERRRSASITAKMIASSTVLVLVLVGVFGIVSAINLGRLFDVEEARLRDGAALELSARGAAEARALARQAQAALGDGDVEGLQALLTRMRADEPDLAWAAITDREGTVLAHSDAANNGRPLPPGPPRALALASVPGAAVLQGERERVFAQPLGDGEAQKGVALVALRPRVAPPSIVELRADKESMLVAVWVRTGLFGLFFAVAAAAVAIFQGGRIARPLRMLAWRADQVARGDLETRVTIGSSDEIGALGENFNFMAERLAAAEVETAARSARQREHEIACGLQRRGAEGLIDRGFVRVAGVIEPAEPSGGDFWSVEDLSDGRVLLLVGDVTGHGVDAAVAGVVARTVSRTLRVTDPQRVTPATLLEVINRVVVGQEPRAVLAAFAAVFDRAARSVTCANAGLSFPYLRRGAEARALVVRGNRLGDVADSRYADETQPLESGDQICWYSDGLLERENGHGEELGERRLRAAIAAGPGDAAALCEALRAQAARFAGDRPRKDDVLVVVAQIV
jgi:HAMP domain-containing protein